MCRSGRGALLKGRGMGRERRSGQSGVGSSKGEGWMVRLLRYTFILAALSACASPTTADLPRVFNASARTLGGPGVFSRACNDVRTEWPLFNGREGICVTIQNTGRVPVMLFVMDTSGSGGPPGLEVSTGTSLTTCGRGADAAYVSCVFECEESDCFSFHWRVDATDEMQ
jgi:hypothetical protein